MNIALLQEAAIVVSDLDDQLREGHRELEDILLLELRADANAVGIFFLGCCIWDTDNEPRQFNEEKDEYEPLMDYVNTRVEVLIMQLGRLIVASSRRTGIIEANEDYRTVISTFLDEADAGGAPSYASLRAVLKQYK